jgi:hypothetical protein
MKVNLRAIAISLAVMGIVGCKSDSPSTPAPQPTAPQPTAAQNTESAAPAEPPKTEAAPAEAPQGDAAPAAPQGDAPASNTGAEG